MKRLATLALIALLASGLGACTAEDPAQDPVPAEDPEEIARLEEELAAYEDSVQTLEEQVAEANQEISSLESEIATLQTPSLAIQDTTLLEAALATLDLFADQDAAGLDDVVSPSRGVRFTPYPYVDPSSDIVFYPGNTVPSMFTNTTVYVWGEYDGTGDTIANDFLGYYSEFVYDEDYLNAHMIGQNTLIGSGNVINNVDTVYAGDQYVEFHFTGFDPGLSGIDWSSLILVFDDDGTDWELVGVVHGQWTI